MYHDGRNINGAWIGEKTTLDSIHEIRMLAQHHRKLAFPQIHGSSLAASEPALVRSDQKCTNGVWFPRRPVNVAQRSRQLSTYLHLVPSITI